MVFAYLSGPVTFMILRKEMPDIPRVFRVTNASIVGYLGFICCSLLIYWSGLNNLIYLFITVLVIIATYRLLINKVQSIISVLISNLFILVYLLCMIAISYLRHINMIAFPWDNVCIIVIAFFVCKAFIHFKSNAVTINNNINKYNTEIDDSKGIENESFSTETV